MAANFLSGPAMSAILVFVVGLLSVAVAYLGYKRAVRGDRVVEKAGIATLQTTSIGQVMEGLTSIGDALRADNRELRTEVATLKASVEEIRARLDAVEVANTDLRTKERALELENGVLRAENQALKLEVEELRARVRVLEKASGP